MPSLALDCVHWEDGHRPPSSRGFMRAQFGKWGPAASQRRAGWVILSKLSVGGERTLWVNKLLERLVERGEPCIAQTSAVLLLVVRIKRRGKEIPFYIESTIHRFYLLARSLHHYMSIFHLVYSPNLKLVFLYHAWKSACLQFMLVSFLVLQVSFRWWFIVPCKNLDDLHNFSFFELCVETYRIITV